MHEGLSALYDADTIDRRGEKGIRVSNDLCFMPATEMLARYRDRSLSPVEVTTAILAQIEAIDPAINAYVTVTGDLAMRQAKLAEQSWQAGIAGDLLGVPISIKDLTATKGIRTTRGSKLYEDWIPDSDAIFVERVNDAGSIMLGKTSSPEFGWKGETTNPVSGTTRNPWNLERTAGGSTGGGAAAVAAGMGPLTQGGDGAGSIRIPSSFCGIYGLKPSLFLVPTYPPSAIPSVAHLGPMTRTVADAALLLNVVAGEDARDRYSWSSNIDYLPLCETRSLEGWRIAWSPDLGYAAVEPEIVAICERQLQVLRDLGAEIVEAHPNLPDPWDIIDDIWAAAMASMHIDDLAEVADRIDPGRKTVVEYGLSISGAQLARQQNRQAEYYEHWRQFMQDYDLFVCPTEPCTAFQAGLDFPPTIAGKERTYLGWTQFTYPFNLTGFPAATVPAGFDADGLPVGLQLVGRWRDDSAVIAASAAYEAAAPWADQRPPLA
jgi:Asp-tRNA(Asn)/Glu-tRNA(Gln) amidotransferase A subunit family amidase